MWITDFEYAGRRLSDFGCVIASFNGGSGIDVKTAPDRQFNTVMNNGSYKSEVTSTTYKDTYPFTIQIAKFRCGSEVNYFTVDEERAIARWLDRNDYHKFKLIHDSGEYHDVVFYGTFNSTPVMEGDDIVGLNSAFTSNAPFAFGEEERINTSLDSTVADDYFTLTDSSDTYGYHYFNCVITIMEDCDFKLSNELDPNNNIEIKNCKIGEVITLDGEHKIITSSYDHPKLYDDFNYSYPRLIRTDDENRNKFTSNASCKFKISFSPVRKVMVL